MALELTQAVSSSATCARRHGLVACNLRPVGQTLVAQYHTLEMSLWVAHGSVSK